MSLCGGEAAIEMKQQGLFVMVEHNVVVEGSCECVP